MNFDGSPIPLLKGPDASARWLRRPGRFDPWLVGALLAAALFCLYGIRWGRAEDWNGDEVALRPLHGLHPGLFYKPPFHTYLNHLVVLVPIHLVERAVTISYLQRPVRFNEARLLGSRLLTAALFLGTVVLMFAIGLRFYGRFAARIIALVFATSAGFIAFAHFLTCDSPLLFWMVAAALFSARIASSGKTMDYVLAGLLTGLASATKYNGALVGITILVGHLFSPNWQNAKSIFHRRFLLGLAMTVIGFVAANPYAVLDHKKFVADFMYNYTVAPRYEGQSGVGYGEFLRDFPEILGLPGTILIGLCAAASLVLLFRRREMTRDARIGFLIAGGVAFVSYLTLGSFARVPTRFVLPTVPFLILMGGPFLARLGTRARRLILLLLVPMLAYNAICCGFVGKRFSEDPRLAAQDWMIANARGKIIQSSYASPHWTKLYSLPGVEFPADRIDHQPAPPNCAVDWRMPVANGRTDLFPQLFAGNRWVDLGMSVEGRPEEAIFSAAGQARRNPDLIAIYSADVEVPVKFVANYYNDLLAERHGYKVVFKGTTPPVSSLLYPETIDFLSGSITILRR